MLIDDDSLLEGSINDLKTANKYEEAAEKENDDINIDASNDDE